MDMTLSISIINRRWRYRFIIRKKTGVGISGNSWIEGIQRNGKGALADLSPNLLALPCDEMTVLGPQSVWITSPPFAESGPAFVGISRKVFREFGLRDVVTMVRWVHRQTDKAAACGLLSVAIGMLLSHEALVSSKKRDASFVAKEGEETLSRRRLREPVSSSIRRGVPIHRDSQRKSLEI